MTAMQPPIGPLSGLRVVEVSSFVATPLCGATLAQLGAEVIRVAPMGGAPDRRQWPVTRSGASLYWNGLNPGKSAIEIDLTKPRGQALVADLAAELGVDPDQGPALAGARSALVLASAAGGLSGPVDGVTGAVDDSERVAADVPSAAALGFSGQICVHPAQIAPAAAALAPTADQVRWAQRVLDAVAGADGGAIVVGGRMVDAPVVCRARRILTSDTTTNNIGRI